MEFIHQPSDANRLGDYLKDNLSKPWTDFRAAVAFVKRSGTRHISTALADFARASRVEFIVGIDHRGTSAEGLGDLLRAVSPRGRVIVFHNRLPITFHPKIFLFKSEIAADAVIGSGNLTEGGLFTNYEAACRLSMDLGIPKDVALLESIEQVFDGWADPSNGISHVLDDRSLALLTSMRMIPSEAVATHDTGSADPDEPEYRPAPAEFPFGVRAEPRAPAVPTRSAAMREVSSTPADRLQTASEPSRIAGPAGFVMTLQQTDVGVGQTRTGTSRRSPEIFIPLAARDANPDFWGWPRAFTEDPSRRGKRDREGVRMRLAGEIIVVNMMTWPDRHDFRLRSEALRSAGNVGDILRLEKVGPAADYEYYVEIIPEDTSQYPTYRSRCDRSVRNSRKKYGYY